MAALGPLWASAGMGSASDSGPRTGFAVKGGTSVPPSTKDAARVTGGFVLWPQRPSLARVVEWIDFETLALLFGMVITRPTDVAPDCRRLGPCPLLPLPHVVQDTNGAEPPGRA